MSILRRAIRWLFGSPSLDAAHAGDALARGFTDGVTMVREEDPIVELSWNALRHAFDPSAPALTDEEQAALAEDAERRRHIPPAPVPDWWGRSPLAEKARRRRKRKRAARRTVG